MLRSIEFLGHSTTAILHHHERWDGRGYPDGLAGPDIPQLARILAVSDTFCALVPSIGVDDSLAALRDRSGTQFDPDCVHALLEVAETAQRLATVGIDPDSSVESEAPRINVQWLDHDLPEVSDLLAFGADRQ